MIEPKGSGEWVLVTPEIAKQWMTRNSSNYRQINNHTVHIYAESMRAGFWQPNGEPIVFDENGILLNGQHRIAAVIESGTSVYFFVISGVNNAVTKYDMPIGRTRLQEARAEGLSASNGALSFSAFMLANPMDYNRKVNTDMVLDYYKKHQAELEEALRIVRIGTNKKPVMKKKAIGATVYIMLRMGYDKKKICDFVSIANTGLPIEGVESTPALVIRRMIQEEQRVTVGAEATMKFIACLIKAYSDFQKGVRRVQNYTEPAERGYTFWIAGKRLDGIDVPEKKKEA